MTTQNWAQILQDAKPQAGFSPLDPGQYRFRIIAGSGKEAATGAAMIAVQMEVISQASQGRKVFSNFVLPSGSKDTDPSKVQDRINRFLGDMEAFGLPKEWFAQLWSQTGPTKDSCEYVGQQLVNRTVKATASLQKDDPSRNNFNNFVADDGVEPPAPARPAAGPGVGIAPPGPSLPGITPPAPGGMPGPGAMPGAPGLPGGFPAPGAAPQPGAQQMAPPASQTAPPAFQPPAQQGAPEQQYAQQAPPQQMAPPQAPGGMPAAPPMPGGAPAFQPPQGAPAFQPPAAPPAAPGIPPAGMPAAPSASF